MRTKTALLVGMAALCGALSARLIRQQPEPVLVLVLPEVPGETPPVRETFPEPDLLPAPAPARLVSRGTALGPVRPLFLPAVVTP